MLTGAVQQKEKNQRTGCRREISYGGTENREIKMRSRSLSTGVSSGLQASGGSRGLFIPGPGHRRRPLEVMTALQQWQGPALLGVRAVPVRTLPGARAGLAAQSTCRGQRARRKAVTLPRGHRPSESAVTF